MNPHTMLQLTRNIRPLVLFSKYVKLFKKYLIIIFLNLPIHMVPTYRKIQTEQMDRTITSVFDTLSMIESRIGDSQELHHRVQFFLIQIPTWVCKINSFCGCDLKNRYYTREQLMRYILFGLNFVVKSNFVYNLLLSSSNTQVNSSITNSKKLLQFCNSSLVLAAVVCAVNIILHIVHLIPAGLV